MRKIKVRTVDTDVVVILVGAVHALSGIQPLAENWVYSLWDGEELPVLSINAICASLGSRRHKLFQYFTLLLGLIQPQLSRLRARILHGKLGRHYKQ